MICVLLEYSVYVYIHIWKLVHGIYLKYIGIIIRRNSFRPKKLYLYKYEHTEYGFASCSQCSHWIATYLVTGDLYKQNIWSLKNSKFLRYDDISLIEFLKNNK